MVAVAREVGRTGAFTRPDVVDAAGEKVGGLGLGLREGEEELVVVGRAAGTTSVVVEGAGILEETLNVLVFVGEAVTVGLTVTVVVEPSAPTEASD